MKQFIFFHGNLINKWQRKYIIYGHGVPKQTYEPMNIDNLIDCLRQLFPEYIKPLFVKTKFFMIITALNYYINNPVQI
jgi:hypothetical protein